MTESVFWTSYEYVTRLLRDLNMRKDMQDHKNHHYSKDLINVSKKGDIHNLHDYMSQNLDYDILLKDESMFIMSNENGIAKMAYLQRPTKYIGFMDFISEYHKDALKEYNKEEDLMVLFEEEYNMHLDSLELNKSALYIRYDEDEEHYKPIIHPFVHLHIGLKNSIRIPSAVEITPLSFTFFVLQHVYYDTWVKEFTKDEGDENHILKYAKKDKIISVDSQHWKDSESDFLHLTRG